MFKSDVFLHIKLCSNKRQLPYQTHGGNFITSQLTIKISRTVLWVCGISSWLRTTSLTKLFSSVQAIHGPLLPMRLLNTPVSSNFISSLLMLIFGHHLFGNSFINFNALYPFKRYNFFIKILGVLTYSSLQVRASRSCCILT